MINTLAEADLWIPAIEAAGTWFLGVVTIGLGVIALFPEDTHGRIYKPKGHVFYGTDSFLLQDMQPGQSPPLYALRLLVTNVGNTLATVLQCHLTDIRVVGDNGREQRWANFIPIRLNWTHLESPVLDYLAVGTSRLVDLGTLSGVVGYQAISTQPMVFLATELGGEHAFAMLSPDTYVLELAITSKERTLFKGCLCLSFADQWHASGHLPAALNLECGNVYTGRLSVR